MSQTELENPANLIEGFPTSLLTTPVYGNTSHSWNREKKALVLAKFEIWLYYKYFDLKNEKTHLRLGLLIKAVQEVQVHQNSISHRRLSWSTWIIMHQHHHYNYTYRGTMKYHNCLQAEHTYSKLFDVFVISARQILCLVPRQTND